MDDWAKRRIAELEAAAPVRRAKREPFILVPLRQLTEVSKTVGLGDALVWVLLLHLAFKAKSLTFSCGNELMGRCGVPRKRKKSTLDKLEAAGWLAVTRRPRKAPIVTLLGVSLPPASGK